MHSFAIASIAISCTFVAVFVDSVDCQERLPILFWHSAGESCCEDEFQQYSSVIHAYLNGSVYIKSVQLGSSMHADKIKSLTMHPFEQLQIACKTVRDDAMFQNGYNAIGLSQGALLLRGLAQTCPFPKMKNLISLGGPHQGVLQYPHCGHISPILCAVLRFQMNVLIYSRPSQYLLAPTTYWHDLNEHRYRGGSTFLAIINNEKEINGDYIKNLKALRHLVLVRYERDESIIPNDSTFFGYWSEQKVPYSLEESDLYKQDRLGLRTMKLSGQLVFLTSPGGHLELNEVWFVENILPYLT